MMKRMRGLGQVPLIIGLVIMAIAVPVATKLAEQSQDVRKSASLLLVYRCFRFECAGSDCLECESDYYDIYASDSDNSGNCYKYNGWRQTKDVCVVANPTPTPKPINTPRPTVTGPQLSPRPDPPTITPGTITPTPMSDGLSPCRRASGVCIPLNLECGEDARESSLSCFPPAPGKCCLPMEVTPTQGLLSACERSGGSCVAMYPCEPGMEQSILACGSGVCCVSSTVSPTPTGGVVTAAPTSGDESDMECNWCTNYDQCVASCGQEAWKGKSSRCAEAGDGCCECGSGDDEPDGPSKPSESVWFNATVWDGESRWGGADDYGGDSKKHEWIARDHSCTDKKGISFVASRNITMRVEDDDAGGHFDMNVYKNREFNLRLVLPEECGYVCDRWRVFDRSDDLDEMEVVVEGNGCMVMFMPENKDWRTGVEFYIARAEPTVVPTLAEEECNRLGEADLAEMEIWRTDYVAGQTGDVEKADWAGDFNCDGYVDIDDREIWREMYMLNLGN